MSHVRGILLVALAAILWSSGGLIVRSIETADSWTIVLWRSATAAIFLIGFLWASEGARIGEAVRSMGWAGILVGLCFTCASISLVVALSLTSVANVLVIMSAAPLLAAVAGRIVLGERIRMATVLAIAATMLGIALLVSQSYRSGRIAGDLVAFLIAMSYAVAIVTMRRHHDVAMTPAVCLGVVVAAVIALPLATPLVVSAKDVSLLVLFGAGQLGLGLALFVAGARLIPAAETALLATLEPILGPLWVWLFIGERPAGLALLGCAIVLASLICNTALGFRRRPNAATTGAGRIG